MVQQQDTSSHRSPCHPPESRQCNNLPCKNQERGQRSSGPSGSHWRGVMPSCSASTQDSQYQRHLEIMSHQHSIPSQQATDESLRQRHHHCGAMGSDERQPPGAGLYTRPSVFPQSQGRWSHGSQAFRCLHRHHNANGPVDLQHVYDIYPRSNWRPRQGTSLENVKSTHVSQRRVISKQSSLTE